jgi:hypothetical protein
VHYCYSSQVWIVSSNVVFEHPVSSAPKKSDHDAERALFQNSLAGWPAITVKICVQSISHRSADDAVLRDTCDHAYNNICCLRLTIQSVPYCWNMSISL